MNSTLDNILFLLEKEKWYVDFQTICETLNILDDNREYIISKLENDGFIEVLRTSDSLDIRISEEGRIFITEKGYKSEAEKIKKETILQSRDHRFNVLHKIVTLVLSLTTVIFGYLTFKNNSKITLLELANSKLKEKQIKIDRTVSETHFFSNTETRDTFKLHIKGEDILSSKIEFAIITNSGIQVFYEVFEARLLIGYGLIGVDNPTINDEENYILKRCYSFFDQSNFRIPAISKDEVFDSDYYDPNYFDLIKNQGNSIAFVFLIGEGNNTGIAYIQGMKKVVKFWVCC